MINTWGVTKELWESEMVSLNQSTLELYVCPSRMLDRSMFVQRVGGRSLMYVCHAWEISPTLILYLFYLIKRNKSGNKQGLYQLKTPGSLKSFYYYCCLLIIVYIFLSVHLTYYYYFFSFNSSKAKVRIAM